MLALPDPPPGSVAADATGGAAQQGDAGGGGAAPLGHAQSLFLTQSCRQVRWRSQGDCEQQVFGCPCLTLTRCVVCWRLQVGAAQAGACLEAALLVHLVLSQQLPGPALLRPSAHSVVAQQLVPWLEQLCTRAVLVLWLASTPSSTGT